MIKPWLCLVKSEIPEVGTLAVEQLRVLVEFGETSDKSAPPVR